MKNFLKLLIAPVIVGLLAVTMAQGHIWQWSKTPSSNATADPSINWAEGMAPSAVNDSARVMMAVLASWRDDISGLLTTGGSSTAYTVTTNSSLASTPATGHMLCFRPHTSNGIAPTLAADGGTAYAIQSAPSVAVSSSVLVSGAPYCVTFSGTAWLLQDFYNTTIAANSIVTSMIADAQVTYAKMQNISASNRLLGRYSSGAGVPQEVTVSTGLNLNTSTGALTAAYPPASLFKNLSIKVASNTTATVAADFVVTTNGTSFQTTALSCTLNLGTTGANALDTGSIAAATWYAVWAIAKNDGTTACLASLQFTANATFTSNLPTDYTYYARIGALRTAAGVAQLLGTWQYGRRAQYVLGLAQTSTLPIMGQSNVGTGSWTAIAVANFVPSTASHITVNGNITSTGVLAAAPNSNYAVVPPSANAPPIYIGQTTVIAAHASMILESSNIYYLSNSSSNFLVCLGWEDNL